MLTEWFVFRFVVFVDLVAINVFAFFAFPCASVANKVFQMDTDRRIFYNKAV